VAEQRALLDLHDRQDGLQPRRLLGRALRGGQADAGAFLDARGEVGARELRIHRQAHPQRVLRLVGARMVAADVLVDHAQVEPEVVGAVAAAEHAAREHEAVVRALHIAGRRIQLGRLRRHARAVALPVQQRAARLAEVAHEDLAQALGVFRRHGHAVAAAPVGGAGPGVAGLHGDGPALEVFLAALELGRAGLGAAVGVHDEHAAVPVLRNGDPVERAGAVFTGVAARGVWHLRRAGRGLGACPGMPGMPRARTASAPRRARRKGREGREGRKGEARARQSFFQWRTPNSSAAFDPSGGNEGRERRC
jgi:hypothetical protein